jgi:hypothetical protein
MSAVVAAAILILIAILHLTGHPIGHHVPRR